MYSLHAKSSQMTLLHYITLHHLGPERPHVPAWDFDSGVRRWARLEQLCAGGNRSRMNEHVRLIACVSHTGERKGEMEPLTQRKR